MTKDERPKYACPFCDRKYRMRLHTIIKTNAGVASNIYHINCQFCLVDINICDSKIFSMSYRLHDEVFNRIFLNFNEGMTIVHLQYKQKKIKNPPSHMSFRFNTCRMVKPKDALGLAKRLMGLWIFS